MEYKEVGLFGSCQLATAYRYFFTDEILNNNNLKINFSIHFFDYDKLYSGFLGKELDYSIFNDIDILIIENNKFENDISSEKIIKYCLNMDIKIIKTCLLKMPIFPINWSGYGDCCKDYENWIELENIDYILKLNNCINKLEKHISNTDLSYELIEYIKNNFNKNKLFLHSLHPTNDLLYQFYKYLFKNLDINLLDYNIEFNSEILPDWINPYPTKMVKDLNLHFDVEISDIFYINKYLDYRLSFFFKNITNKHPLLNLKYTENNIIDGNSLCPINYINDLEKYFYRENKIIHYNGNTIHNLPEKTIYFIISNQYSPHFHHVMFELLFILQIYLLYCDNVLINNNLNFKILCKSNDFANGMLNDIIDIFNIRKDILITNDTDFYKGNFVYLAFQLENINSDKIRIKKEEMTILKKLIDISKLKYNEYPYYDKLWVSRNNLNIETYWHKRFITNIMEISDFIKSKGFFEINFGEIDIYYQIYLINKATTVFSEIGASMNNMFFMENNSNWITNNDPNSIFYSLIAIYISKLNNIEINIFDNLKIDSDSKYYNIKNSLNQPYKINNIDEFKQWFITI